MIPFVKIDSEIDKKTKLLIFSKIRKIIESKKFSSGDNVKNFESNFSHYVGSKYCVAVNSGTTALHLSLLSIGIKKGDEVILAANSFISTAWAISYCDAKPIFVDVDDKTFLINVNSIKKMINKKTKCILVTHLYGQPADVLSINKLAKKYNIKVVEDSAQAHGASINSVKIGGHGNIDCFSFYPTKNLGAYGEGGAITTNNKFIYNKLLLLRNHAQKKKYLHEFLSYNCRFDEIQACILNIKLKKLDKVTINRNRIASIYFKELRNVHQIQLPHIKDGNLSSFHLFVIHTKNRNKLRSFLLKNKIETGLHYPIPIHLQPAYKNLNYKTGDLINCEYNSNNCLSLPIYSGLKYLETKYICNKIKFFYKCNLGR